MTSQPVVTTRYGAVRGRTAEYGVLAFRGIPYAAPPIGSLRFQPPEPPEPWQGVREAAEYGPTAPQRGEPGPLGDLLPNVVIPGDDCLNLNVWTADTTGARPVMVFVHGGAFVTGSGAVPLYDGRRFARDGVVLVTVNYRLGADGFLWFGDGLANLGLLDQVAALTWVRENIAAFGGDPANVTAFGASAGGMSVCALLAMPVAQGLFRRAIAESGAAHMYLTAGTARLIGTRLAEILDVEPTREAVAAVPVDRLLLAQQQVSAEISARPDPALWGEAAGNRMPFEPVVDGEVLPASPIEGIARGAGAGVDVLIGSNSEEFRLFLVPRGAIDHIDEPTLLATVARYGLPSEETVRTYLAVRPTATPGDLLSAVITDRSFRLPAIRVAEVRADQPGTTHLYEFGWRSPAHEGRLGACHGIELPFVFDNLDDPGVANLLGGHAPQHLADEVHSTWISFATNGDPGWSQYVSHNRVAKRFDTTSTVTTDSHAAERVLWDGHRYLGVSRRI